MRQYFRYLIFTLLIIFSLFGNAVSPAYAASLPAEINKQFTPLQIDAGGVSVLRVTIFNPNTFPLTNASWTDNLAGVQPGLSIANPANVVNTCGGVGDVTAVPGTTNLALSNGTVPAQVGATPGECYVEVNVTSVTPGNLINTIPANNLNADGNDGGTPVVITNTTPASATITVIAVAPPTLAKGFSPNTIFVGGISRLTITVNNNDGDTNLTGTSFTDTLPAGLVLASSVNATVTGCGGGYSLTANPGGTTIALTNATVTPSTDCVVAVDVTGATGTYTNTIPAGPGGPGSIVTDQGVTNASPASSNLNIQPMGLIKAFSPDSIVAGGTSTLTITLQNPTGSAYTGVDVTDNLPAGLQVSGIPTTTCVGGTMTNTLTSVTLTNGTVPASAMPPTPPGTCTITVTVFSPLTTFPATLTNTIPANSVSADQPGVTNYFPATDTIAITAPLTGAKAYSPTTIPLGGVSTVTITLNNNSATNLTNVNFTDVLPANLTVSGTPSSPQCGGIITNTATSVTLAGGSIAAGTSCTIVFNVTSSVPGSGTTYENTIPANNITTAQGVGNSTTIRTGTDLTVVNSTNLPVGVNKAFNTSPIVPGQPTRLRITITAPADTNLTGLSISDTLPTGLVIVGTGSTPPAPANPSENCTGGTLVAPIGGDTISLSGASIDAGTSCRIDVYVTSSTPGIYNNTIPANTITTTEGRTNTADSNTATVRVTSMSMSKTFYSDIVQANGISTLTITLENTMDSPLTNVSVTDNLPGSVTNGIVVAPIPNASTTCGSGVITANAGTQTISMSGGTVPAQVGGIPGICTITVNVQGRDSTPASPSTFTNTIPIANVAGTVQSTGTVINPAAQAQDDLRIRPLTIGVVKGFNPVLVYGGASSTLSIQLINPNNAPLVGIQFTDDMTLLGTGMVIANPANLNVGTCGGSISGNPGDTSFTFTGGTLPPNTNCTLTLSVTMQVNGNLTNLIPAGAVTTLNGVSSPDPTQASLTNLPGVSVSKTFSPATVLANQVSTLTITITNTSLVPVVNMGVADNLPGALPTGLAVANPANAVNNCGGTLTAVPGSQNIQLSGGGLQPFGSPGDVCTISVDVISTEPGVYINTIPAGTLTADGGVTNNDPATDTLTVNPSFSLGNRVWFDTDNSATINGAEIGIDGVDVELYRADGTLVGTQTTANGGYYRFDNLPAGDYFVVIPASEFGTGGTLDGYLSSSTSIAANGTISETTAPDPDDNVDSDDNGTLQTSGTYSGGVISSQITLGPTANEPTDDTDADPTNPPGEASNTQSNRSVDFGFYRQTLGNQIYIDVNNNGTYDAGDTALAGAIVQLFASDGVTEINVGPDGILGTADDASGGVTTGVGGTYLFSGLPAGDYIVRVTPPAGYASTIDTANSSDTTDPDDDIDNNDNGIGTGLGQVSSAVVTLTPGSAGVSTTVDDSTGTTANPSLDFGFSGLTFSLGNRVWYDTDNSGTINGSEVGVDGVTVQVFAADVSGNPVGAALGTDTTANGGYYRFDNLPAGDYVVVIPATQFASGGPLAGYWSSGTTMSGAGVVSEVSPPDPDNNVDSDDNGGLQPSGAVISNAVTLGPSANEPTSEADIESPNPSGEAPNDQSNLTVDFGFYRQTLGNQIYIDVNNNGTYDAGDTALAGAIVQLFASDGVTEINVGPDGILGTADDASGGVTTGVGGTYLFSGLPAGDYIVRVTPPAGYASTIDTANSSDTTDPDDDIDNNDNGIGTGLGQVSSAVVTLTPGSAGVSTTVDDSTGTTANPSLDFGFTSNSGFTKTIVSTDASHTSGLDVAIGEIITYRITIDLPLGITFNNTTITDQLDLGLAFVDCLSVMVQGVDQTATVCPPAVTPAVGTSANPAEDGRQAVFTLPTPITATTSNEQIVIEYRAIVLDVIENQEGVDLNNSVTWAWQGGSVTTSAPDVEIVEPDMQISKSATPVANVPIGTPIQFTLVIDHTTPQSETDAFDVIVTDVLPANLQYIPCSATFAGLAPTSHTASCPAPTSNLTFVWDVFPLGQTATITFNAYLLGTPAINSASVAWTSLPIDPQVNGDPVQLSPFNTESTERFYDPLDAVNIYSVSDSVTINGVNVIDDDNSANLPSALPLTGFAPNVVTEIPQQPKEKAYTATDVWLEIPSLGVNMPIVGVPLLEEDWDVTWLWKEAGWLEGTAFPGWQGNSGLTGHVTLPNGEDGPFAKLGELEWGDKIIVHAYDSLYTYEVQKTVTVSPYNMTVLGHKDDAWLTLITCESYNEGNNTYAKRIAVQAVLLKVSQNKKPYVPAGIH